MARGKKRNNNKNDHTDPFHHTAVVHPVAGRAMAVAAWIVVVDRASLGGGGRSFTDIFSALASAGVEHRMVVLTLKSSPNTILIRP